MEAYDKNGKLITYTGDDEDFDESEITEYELDELVSHDDVEEEEEVPIEK